MRSLLITAPLWLALWLPTNGLAQYSGGPYTLTIFADEGINASSAAAEGTSSRGSNLGHVFVELTNAEKQMYLGYYGDPNDPSRGQLRVDADLASKGDWDVKETYQITEQGYDAAHKMIDTWGRGDQPDLSPIPVILQKGTWWPWCNCGDFAEAIATVAGVRLEGLPKNFGVINRPSLWAKYLRAHGGTVNPQRQSQPVAAVIPKTRAVTGCARIDKGLSNAEQHKELDGIFISFRPREDELHAAVTSCEKVKDNCDQQCNRADDYTVCSRACAGQAFSCEASIVAAERKLQKEKDGMIATQYCCGTKYEWDMAGTWCRNYAFHLANGWYDCAYPGACN